MREKEVFKRVKEGQGRLASLTGGRGFRVRANKQTVASEGHKREPWERLTCSQNKQNAEVEKDFWKLCTSDSHLMVGGHCVSKELIVLPQVTRMWRRLTVLPLPPNSVLFRPNQLCHLPLFCDM